MSDKLSEFFLHQAKRAYGMFARTVEVQNQASVPMPTWDELEEAHQVGWVAATVELCRPVEVVGGDPAPHLVEQFAARLHEELGIDPDRVNAKETAEVVRQVLDHHSLELAHRRP